MKAKIWLTGYFIIVVGVLATIGAGVIIIDPFFHFHKPDTENFFYTLNNERSQNNGIMRHFDYNALITGTSMTENFKTSEMDSIFGVKSIKVSFSGAPYKEINNNLISALSYNPNLKTIVRSLDMNYFFDDSNRMRTELGIYPTYLYDNNVFNDIKYIFNRDIVFKWMYEMVRSKCEADFVPGITSFDDYENWADNYTYGIKTVGINDIVITEPGVPIHITESEKETIYNNIYANVISLAEQYPDVTFYCFIPPYSIAWWQPLVVNGEIYKQIEAEEYIIELILECENIKLYSFNNNEDIITDLNNYKDTTHYGPWINSLILKWMYSDKGLLTKENYKSYLSEELDFYISYDYASLQNQVDYKNDYFADALVNEELNNVKPIDILFDLYDKCTLQNANVSENQYESMLEMECYGSSCSNLENSLSVANCLMDDEYCGAKILIEEISGYRYLVFYGKKTSEKGLAEIHIYDENNELLTGLTIDYSDVDSEWHQYLIDISEITGTVTVLFNNQCYDPGSSKVSYTFGDIVLY